MTIRNKIKTGLLGLLGAATIASTPVMAEEPAASVVEKPKVEFGYNAVENGFTDQGDLRTRILTNADVEVGDWTLGISSLNQFENSNPGSYFGNNRVLFGPTEQKDTVRGIVRNLTNPQGVIDTKVGLRFPSAPKLIGADYGFLDVTRDLDSSNVHFFVGKNITDQLKASVSLIVEAADDGDVAVINELQAEYSLSDHFSLFAREEMKNGKHSEFLGGLIYKTKFDPVSFSGDALSGSITTTYQTKELVSFGFTLHDAPQFEVNLTLNSGDWYIYSASDFDAATQEHYTNLTGVGKSIEIGAWSGILELEHYAVAGFDNWFEVYGNIGRDVGPIRASLHVSKSIREDTGGFVGLGIDYSKELGPGNVTISNLLGYGDNFFGVSGPAANTTSVTYGIPIGKNFEIGIKAQHNHAFSDALENNNSVGAYGKIKF